MSNIAYDVVEWMNILGTAKTLTKATRDNIRKAMATGDKFAIVRTLNAIPNADRSQILRAIGGFAGGSLAEMADEMTMSILKKMFAGVSEEQLQVTIQTIIQIEDNLKDLA